MYKKGDKHKTASYLTVSLTSITCKLLEHIIHSAGIAQSIETLYFITELPTSSVRAWVQTGTNYLYGKNPS